MNRSTALGKEGVCDAPLLTQKSRMMSELAATVDLITPVLPDQGDTALECGVGSR